MMLQHEIEKISGIDIVMLYKGLIKIPAILKQTKKDVELSQTIEGVIRAQKLPYNKGVVYYHIDRKNKSIIVFVPVKRRTLKVGEAILKLEEQLKEALQGWNVEVYTKRFLNHNSWGVQKDMLWEITLKK